MAQTIGVVDSDEEPCIGRVRAPAEEKSLHRTKIFFASTAVVIIVLLIGVLFQLQHLEYFIKASSSSGPPEPQLQAPSSGSSEPSTGDSGSVTGRKPVAPLKSAAPHFDVIPLVSLDHILPDWAASIHFLKIDTQGNELKILAGAKKSLASRRFRYVQYELSPWLMQREKTGDPLTLLHLLPDMGALCFDMLQKNTHNALPRPGRPLEAYFDHLNAGNHTFWNGKQVAMTLSDPKGKLEKLNRYGPWDDILCAWFEGVDSARDFAEHWRCPAAMKDLQVDGFKERQHGGVSSLLREHGCGHENLKPPSGVMGRGTGKVIVDVGLGTDAAETHIAVGNGYTVFSFEFLPANFRAIQQLRQFDSRYRFVELGLGDLNGQNDFLMPELPQPPAGGFAYIIHAGLTDEEGSVRVPSRQHPGLGFSVAGQGRP